MTTTTEVPGLYPVAINGRGYLVDTADERFRRATVPLIRGQGDSSDEPSERTLNPEDLWRRAIDSWHHGAGQVYRDRADSDKYRFRSSKGFDVWTKGQLSVLHYVNEWFTSAATNLALVVAGSRLYFADGQTLRYATVLGGARTTVTGTPAQTVNALASDGFRVWAAYNNDGIWRTDTSTGAATEVVTDAVAYSALGYVKGRWMVAVGNALYNVTDLAGPAALPAALYTHPNTAWTWVGFAEGTGYIYAAGYSGDKSLIYKTAVKADGTALDIPIVAGELPDGEIVRTIYGYLGFIVIGTDKGFRLAIADTSGNLTLGALVDLGVPVRCFEGQDRFVWFGWTNYDSSSTGLGRMDLSVILDGQVPAYASDLMSHTSPGQGDVLSVVTFGGLRVFAASGWAFLYEDAADLALSPQLETGIITFGTADTKTAVYVDVRNEASVLGYGAALATEGEDASAIEDLLPSVGGGAANVLFDAGGEKAEKFEVSLRGARGGLLNEIATTVTRITLMAYPAAVRTIVFDVPLVLKPTVDVNGTPITVDVQTELDAIDALVRGGELVEFQEGAEVHTVQVLDYERTYDHVGSDGVWFGKVVVRMKKLGGTPTYFRAASSGSSAPAVSVATSLPTGVQPGDLLTLAVLTGLENTAVDAGTVSTPAGWTLDTSKVNLNQNHYVFSRVYQQGDSAPTLTISAASGVLWAMCAYTRGSASVDADEYLPDPGYLPSLTTTGAGAIVIASVFGLDTGGSTPSISNPYVERTDVTLVIGATRYRMQVGDGVFPLAGPTGARVIGGSDVVSGLEVAYQ